MLQAAMLFAGLIAVCMIMTTKEQRAKAKGPVDAWIDRIWRPVLFANAIVYASLIFLYFDGRK